MELDLLSLASVRRYPQYLILSLDSLTILDSIHLGPWAILDLADSLTILHFRFAQAVAARPEPLSLLINNAGILVELAVSTCH